MLAERCFHALDHDRLEFHDTTGRCAVAGAAAVGLGLCVLAAPEIIVGAVVVAGVVVVGFAIKETLDAYELKWADQEDARPMPETRPVPETTPASQEPSPKQRPKPGPNGPDFPPVGPTDISERERHRCEPVPAKRHLGGNKLHDKCADRIPNNSFPGGDVFVNGKNFDALQLATRTLWEVKTNDVETYNPYILRVELDKQIKGAQRERTLAAACGYDFVIGVRTERHKKLLESRDFTLKVVVMDWC